MVDIAKRIEILRKNGFVVVGTYKFGGELYIVTVCKKCTTPKTDGYMCNSCRLIDLQKELNRYKKNLETIRKLAETI